MFVVITFALSAIFIGAMVAPGAMEELYVTSVMWMPFWTVGVVSGIIWGLWHVPAILGTDYNAGTGSAVFQVSLFFANVITASVIFAYFTFKARSLWPAAILHASHNLFVQQIYTPLTIFGADTHKCVDEFGIMLPIIYAILAVYFVRRARIDGL